MHSAKYAFVAGVDCSNGTLVMISSSAFLMTSTSEGLNLCTPSTPWRNPYHRHTHALTLMPRIDRHAALASGVPTAVVGGPHDVFDLFSCHVEETVDRAAIPDFDKRGELLNAFAYLRTPGAKVLPIALSTLGARGKGAAGPVFLHVGTASVEPTEGHTYDPTDGATTDPYPAVPACASAAVPERANAVASRIVLSFMAVSILAVGR
jgi:hypothetical protein